MMFANGGSDGSLQRFRKLRPPVEQESQNRRPDPSFLIHISVRQQRIDAHIIHRGIHLCVVRPIFVMRIGSGIGRGRPLKAGGVVVSESLNNAVRLVVGWRALNASPGAKVVVILDRRAFVGRVGNRGGISKSSKLEARDLLLVILQARGNRENL